MQQIIQTGRKALYLFCLFYFKIFNSYAQFGTLKSYGFEFQYNKNRYTKTLPIPGGAADSPTLYDISLLPSFDFVVLPKYVLQVQAGVDIHKLASPNFRPYDFYNYSLRFNVNFPIPIYKTNCFMFDIVVGASSDWRIQNSDYLILMSQLLPSGNRRIYEWGYNTEEGKRFALDIKPRVEYQVSKKIWLSLFVAYSYGLNNSGTAYYHSYYANSPRPPRPGDLVQVKSAKESYFYFGCSFSRNRN